MRSLVSLISITCIMTALAAMPITAQADELDDLLGKVAVFDWGKDASALDKVSDMVDASHNDAAKRKRIAQKLAGLLSTNATFAGKQFACRLLWRIGDASVVPAVAKLLTDEKSANMARYALERMPDAAAGAALRDALPKTSGGVKVGIINSLGQRCDALAVTQFEALLKDKDPAIACASALALGKVGNGTATDILLAAREQADAKVVGAIGDALVMCAEQLAADGLRDRAEALYVRLYWRREASGVRAAALMSLVELWGDSPTGIKVLAAALASEDRAVRQAAGNALIKLAKHCEQARLMESLVAANPQCGADRLLGCEAK